MKSQRLKQRKKNDKQKIIIFVGTFYPKVGGVENVVYNIIKRIKEGGYNAEVITKKHDDSLDDEEIINGVKVSRIPIGDSQGKARLFKIWRWMKDNKEVVESADLLQFHDQSTFWWTLPLFFSVMKKKRFMIFHGYESYPVKIKFKLIRWFLSKIMNDFACVAKSLENFYPVKSRNVFYNGVEKVAEKKKKKKDACFIARLESDTFPVEYLKALLTLKTKYKTEIKLDVYGDGSLREECERFVKDNKLKVRFLGHVPNAAKKIKDYKYMFATQYLSVLEGMASRTLIFSMTPNKFREDFAIEIFDGEKRGVIVRDQEALTKELLFFKENKVEYNRRVNAAVKFAKANTWDKVVSNFFFRIYNSLLKE